MPPSKYFITVGSVLAVLLLIAGWSFPPRPASFPDRPEVIERVAIRIRSAHTWPEKIVLDTNQPMIPALAIEVAPTEPSVESPPEKMADQTRVDSLAGSNPEARPIDAHRPSAQAKRRTARSLPSAHVARIRNRNERPTSGTSEECCWAEWADRPAMSKAASRKRLARHDSWTGWYPGGKLKSEAGTVGVISSFASVRGIRRSRHAEALDLLAPRSDWILQELGGE